VRARALEALEDTDLDAPNPLLRKGFVFGLVLQHELQQQETLLQTLQLRTGAEYPLPRASRPELAPAAPDEIEVPGGSFTLGSVDEPWAYDNELVAHEVELAPYRIDRTPVTNAAFAQFVEDRGYRSKRHWSPAGWEWRAREGATAPLYWEKGKDGWERIRFGRREPLPMEEPVQHVSYHEAEAFARWAGKRLPTEAEWERAAGWDERRGKMRYPWGRESMGYEANLGRRRFSPAPAGSYGGGVSPVGCTQMAGDVWEWTSSQFQPYPGFLAFPYPEYSEVFFGEEYRVLKGGSWATDQRVARTSFRNWDYPVRRQIFAGFRCARDG
jgi:iron(II)-dependent oxidoreductase